MPLVSPMTETIQSRFGSIAVDASKSVFFPRGLLGMPDKSRFVLANFPSAKMQQFTLLQSLDDQATSFITLPLNLQNGIIAYADLKTALQDLQINEAQAAILLIVTVHRQLDQVKLSVNARAPLLLNAETRSGAQYVFHQDRYKVQHML